MQLHDHHQNITVLTGAGISKASGLDTFREDGGAFLKPMTAEELVRDADEHWRAFVESWWPALRAAEPNPAHRALAAFEDRLAPDQTLTLITQNVDGLHHKAGSRNVVEVHGTMARFRCHACREPIALETIDFASPTPPRHGCGGLPRPDVVLFGELLDQEATNRAMAAALTCDLFVAVGTSSVVFPVASLAPIAKERGTRLVWINPEPPPREADIFDEVILQPAEVGVPAFFGVG